MIAVQFAHTDSCTKHSGYIEVFYFERELVFDHFNMRPICNVSMANSDAINRTQNNNYISLGFPHSYQSKIP